MAAKNAGLKFTPLYDLHMECGARMVPFAGYSMPVQYPDGIMKEHLHTRKAVGLFDVSHMGQFVLEGPNHEATSDFIEALVPSNIRELQRGKQRYTVLLNQSGGILDDLMIARPEEPEMDGNLLLVVNAACKHTDFDYINAVLPEGFSLIQLDEKALIALQGPKAEEVLALHAPEVSGMAFMSVKRIRFDDIEIMVSRSGYTGEDGFELSMPAGTAEPIARALLADERVRPIGLGARDSLRLEAGLCLYGHDMNESNSPIEANIAFCIQKRRRETANFVGGERIVRELAQGPDKRRIGLLLKGRAPAREGADICLPETNEVIGKVTSGGFSPTLGQPIAMGYVPEKLTAEGTEFSLIVRGKALKATVTSMPFVQQRYYRAKR
ncbi:glycine cleavage system aminomethyltransferase GcvT [Flexibacterium corallicola]|uniref:glycine cleavage system aminomethyltransferase GcvT n=1 Tax=Flexibacterium corallicola TaxID=3037259 RepID=UPI00286FAC51|nr:glycine cleavage system aminomethyltransferase GcvT [Pseudovibrio sp. M1P-2-3]